MQGGTPGRRAPGFKRVDPPFPLPTATRAEVHTRIGTGIDDFFNVPLRGGDNRPRRVLLGGITGSGKSEALGKKLPHQIAAWKAQNREAQRKKLPPPPYRVLVAVETHHLGRPPSRLGIGRGVTPVMVEPKRTHHMKQKSDTASGPRQTGPR